MGVEKVVALPRKGISAAFGRRSRLLLLLDRPRFGWRQLAILAALAATSAALYPFDRAIVQALDPGYRTPLWDVARVATLCGRGSVIGFALLYLAAVFGLRAAAIRAAVACLIVGVAVVPVKELVARPRPYQMHKLGSFPSGDVAAAASAAIALASEVRAARLPGLALVGAVGLSRVALGRHYPSDVAAGTALGALAAFLAPRIVLAPAARRRLRRSRLLLGAGLLAVALVLFEPEQDLNHCLAIFGPAAGIAVVRAYACLALRGGTPRDT